MDDYVEFSEELLNKWKGDNLGINDNFGFDFDALPEPYLSFGNDLKNITFLTNNPGGVMDFQKKDSSFVNKNESYQNLSSRLGQFYEETLSGPSKTRINNMYEISNKLGTKGFTQFEISPFHSPNFPGKEKFAKYILENKNNIHSQYITLLKDKLKNLNSICIQGGYPNLDRLYKSYWIKLISEIFSVHKDDWKSLYFKIKNQKATTGAFYHKTDSLFKVILFNSGGNYCPKIDSMKELFRIINN